MKKTEMFYCVRCQCNHCIKPVLAKPEPTPRKVREPQPTLPVSDALRAKLPFMSRQRRLIAIRLENKLCVACGKEPISAHSSRYGDKCLVKHRERMREETEAKTRYKTGSYASRKKTVHKRGDRST